jgi:hypothetical protein
VFLSIRRWQPPVPSSRQILAHPKRNDVGADSRFNPGLCQMMIGSESCRLTRMVDIDLLVEALRNRGHRVEDVISVPDNAGVYELTIDGTALNLEQARSLLEQEETK